MTPVEPAIAPERMLSIAYAPVEARAALMALWHLDATLAEVLRSTTEPMIGRMRLTWWHDALIGLEQGPPPAEPLLIEIARTLPTRGVSPALLTPLIDGWEVLLDPFPIEPGALHEYAEARGGGLFRAAGAMLGGKAPEGIAIGGQLWALVDLAFHISDRATAERAIAAARALAKRIPSYWPRRQRALGVLVMLARRDALAGLARPPRAGAPGRMLRTLWHGMSGR